MNGPGKKTFYPILDCTKENNNMCGPNYVGEPGDPGLEGSDDPKDVPQETWFEREKREKSILHQRKKRRKK